MHGAIAYIVRSSHAHKAALTPTPPTMPREFPDTGQIEMSGRVDKRLYDEFVGRFPHHGATTWFIRTSLVKFLDTIRDDPSLEEQVAEAMRSLAEQPFGP